MTNSQPLQQKDIGVCANCGAKFRLREWHGERRPWGTHSLPFTTEGGAMRLFVVLLCVDCRTNKSREELDVIAEHALLERLALTEP